MRDWLEGIVSSLRERPFLREVVVVAVALVAAVVLGAVIGTVLAGGGSGPASSAATTLLRPAITGELLAAPKAVPKRLAAPYGMGSKSAGVAVVARSQVDKVVTGKETRRAPEGSRMFAFRLDDWACQVEHCASWKTLHPKIDLDGTEVDLPSGDTFVVVVPPGVTDIDLTIDADGFQQSLSVLEDALGEDNIEILDARDQMAPIVIGASVRLAETTSVALTGPDGQPTTMFYRTVTVSRAQRQFFFKEAAPSDPRNAFLVVSASYLYDGQQQPSAFAPGEIKFVLDNGKSYAARDLDPSPDIALTGFEIPASAKHGNLVIGGEVPKVSTTGVAYVASLQVHEIKIDLR